MEDAHQKYRTELPKPVRAQLDIQDQYDLKQLRQALRGEQLPPAQHVSKGAAAKAVVPRGAPQDLVSSLANRLTKVEMENQQLKTMLKRANDENTALRQKMSLCRLAAAGEQANLDEITALKSYIATLQQQLYDIEAFLDENGLLYVEFDEKPEVPAAAPPADAWVPPERHILEGNIRKLNQLVSKDRVVVTDGDNKGHYDDKPSVPVRFYPNGIFIKRGPFRAYDHDPTARAFVVDIEAGFLPSEFREAYPDGISIDASFETEPFKGVAVELFRGQAKTIGANTDTDAPPPPPPPNPAQSTADAIMQSAVNRSYMTVSEYGAKHTHAFDELLDQRANMEKPMSLQRFLSRVKGNYVSNGQVVSMKEALGLLVRGNVPANATKQAGKGDDLSSTKVISEAAEDGRLATLRIRVSSPDPTLNDQHLLLKLPFSTTIGSVIAKIASSLEVDQERVRLHRPYGRDLMEDHSATLEDAECTPNARLFVKLS